MTILKRTRLKIIFCCIVITILIGVWYWHWQAPYRTLISFLRALEQGDVDTIYALSSYKERNLGLTKELVERSYYQFLKPILIKQYQLMRIRRISVTSLKPELWIRQYSVPFVLYFLSADSKRIIVLSPVVRYPGEYRWCIPFSYFVYRTANAIYNDRLKSFELLHKLGFKVILNDLGDTRNVKSALDWERFIRYQYILPSQ